MRVSTQEFYQSSLYSLLNQQSTLNNLSQQLSTGNALINPTNDPVGNAQVLDLNTKIANLGSYQQSNTYAQQGLSMSSSTLQSVGTLMNQVQQLAVQMNNATVNSNDLQNAVTTMQGNLQQLVQLANTQDANGTYIYGGSNAQTPPFQLQSDGTVQYMGDSSQKTLQIGPGLTTPVSQAGNAIFMNVPAGNGTFSVTASGSNYLIPATSGATATDVGNTTLGPGSVLNQATADSQFVADNAQYEVTISNTSSGLTYTVSSGTGTVDSTGWSASSGTVVSGTYTPGQSINIPGTLGGSPFMTVSTNGQPVSGQTAQFTLAAAKPQSIFQTFSDLIAAFTGSSGSPGANTSRSQNISNALANLNQFQTTLLSTQAQIGSNIQQAQSVQSLNANLTQQFQTDQGNIADVSYPQVITQFQESSTALQAAQKAFVQVQGLSLFNYIS
ncbi:flagellar hook-associated protein FlgL [Acidithiobacillus thiooxidans]|uniref:Flagellar hook-associated protein 3 n=1 Tax=Acidithiobacillus thiooxidans ATCC 19377 TaxID=637390 RepID=A0A543Q7R5_ACITH|nr:flagellar hook-associated protein FlgL [Acidithiobacillus thiooxidans]MDR7927861.1 flagellar hook-associated protein FlgL [Acidithiobacillus thiooxidans]MDX5936114.1 flagellar hook-associated protein FlgL [Acidithiobacillus thiooxidans]TQN52381.1 Flagellar hook-associated protein 3 [Acidithiobacillus thiooxidans ATCC 19377]